MQNVIHVQIFISFNESVTTSMTMMTITAAAVTATTTTKRLTTTTGLLWFQRLLQVIPGLKTFYKGEPAPCGLWGCKIRPAPFPGWMSYYATKPGSVWLIS